MVLSPNHPIQQVACSIAHAELIAALHIACFEAAWSVTDFQDLLILPTVFGFLAQSENDKSDQTSEIMGFVLCQATQEECEILTIGVLPEWRRQGVAGTLLQWTLTRAEETGVLKVFLEVAENNNPAFELYRANGFEDVGRRSNYYQTSQGRVDALIFAKNICV